MNVRLKTLATNAQERWNSLDKQQRIKIIAASMLTLVTFIVAMYILLKPNMIVIMSDSNAIEIKAAGDALSSAGISSKMSDDGSTLMVNEKDKVNAEVILVTETTIGGNSDHMTFEDAFNLMSLGTTESVKTEALLRAKGGEIAKDLEAFDGVNSATVEIAAPKDNQFFLENADPATASVQLVLSKEISDAQAETVARYVAAAVVGLDVKNVVVSDSKMNILYSGDMQNDVTKQYDIEAQKKSEIEENVKKQLEPLYNDIRVMSTLRFDWDTSQVNSTVYEAPNAETPTVGIVKNESSSQEKVEGGSNGAAPGTSTNGGTEVYGQTSGTQSADAKSSDKNYVVNETITATEKSGGVIDYDNSSISVNVYNYVYYDEQVLLKNGTLEGTTWEDFKLQTVATPMEVDAGIANSISAATGIANVNVMGSQVPIFIDKVDTPPQVREIAMFVVLGLLILLLAFLIIRNTQIEEIEEVEPELSVEDLLVSTRVEETTELQQAEEIKLKQENAMKTQIEKFVTERPDAAAQLLRNWLNEDWE